MNGHFKSYECPRLWSSRILLLVTMVLNLLHPIFSKLRNNLRILRIFLLSAGEASFVTVFLYGFQFHHQIDNQWFQSTNTRTCDTENERNDSYLSPSSYNSSFNLIVTKRVLEIDEWFQRRKILRNANRKRYKGFRDIRSHRWRKFLSLAAILLESVRWRYQPSE